MNYEARTTKRVSLLVLMLSCLAITDAMAVIHSVIIDRENDIVVINGIGLSGSSYTVAGIAITTIDVSDNVQHISFSELEPVVTREGSYNIIGGGSVFSMYTEAAIVASPPPPPPPVSPDCPCIAGWEASDIPKDNFSWCSYGLDGTQAWISASRDPYFIATAFDPNNIFFDPVNVGNSVSFCALNDGTAWTVAEPVLSQEQYGNCELWMWQKICL